jgi:hypothetical protein
MYCRKRGEQWVDLALTASVASVWGEMIVAQGITR